MGQLEHFIFEVQPWVENTPNGQQSRSLKITAMVNGELFFAHRVMPSTPANKTEIEYYTDMAVRMLHKALDDYDNDKQRATKDVIDQLAIEQKLQQAGA